MVWTCVVLHEFVISTCTIIMHVNMFYIAACKTRKPLVYRYELILGVVVVCICNRLLVWHCWRGRPVVCVTCCCNGGHM